MRGRKPNGIQGKSNTQYTGKNSEMPDIGQGKFSESSFAKANSDFEPVRPTIYEKSTGKEQ